MKPWKKTGLVTLDKRREILTGKFAIESFKSKRHNDMFTQKVFGRAPGRYESIVQEKQCRTDRYYKSAVPYMSRMLNNVKISTSNVPNQSK